MKKIQINKEINTNHKWYIMYNMKNVYSYTENELLWTAVPIIHCTDYTQL